MIETIADYHMDYLDYKITSSCNWFPANRYVFAFQEKVRKKISQRKNKIFLTKEMEVLRDKHVLLKSLFKKFDK